MRVAIHQPHYFPWLGYFYKMSKSDKFILLDDVQLEKGSFMYRNRVLCNGEIKYITISADKKDFLNTSYCKIPVKNKELWTKSQLNSLSNYYRKAPHFEEAFSILEEFLSRDYQFLSEWVVESTYLCMNFLGLTTDTILQTDICLEGTPRKSDLVLSLCEAVGASTYVSGSGGSVNYLKKETFTKRGIDVEFINYKHPIYKQVSSGDFIQGLSVIDCLFNLGVDETRKLFLKSLS